MVLGPVKECLSERISSKKGQDAGPSGNSCVKQESKKSWVYIITNSSILVETSTPGFRCPDGGKN